MMLKPISKKFKGLITISGPTNSGKSQLAEYLISDQKSVTYIATSKARDNDPEWVKRINMHRIRRPSSWNLIEHPHDICNAILALKDNDSILIDSLGGLVEQHLIKNGEKWELFQTKFLNCILNSNFGIIIVFEEIGWGIVPSTPIGHLFRERLCKLSSLLCNHSSKKWLVVNRTAIDLDEIGHQIP